MSIRVSSLSKSFGSPSTQVLRNLTFSISSGEFIAITGKSGSGKSTLLYILSTLDQPSAGSVYIAEELTTQMNDKDLHVFRNLRMGFIFQFHYLLPELTVIENVLMPTRKTDQQREKEPFAREILQEFDLKGKFDRFPSQLSGGEQQRVAIARALVMKPAYIFADEPTGNLDSVNGDKVLNILESISRDQKTTVVMVTHDADYAARATRQIHLVDGQILA